MSPQAGWLLQEQVVPRLRSVIPHAVHCVGCEDAEELIQDATALAAGIHCGPAQAATGSYRHGNEGG
jgi:hypothetical protein